MLRKTLGTVTAISALCVGSAAMATHMGGGGGGGGGWAWRRRRDAWGSRSYDDEWRRKYGSDDAWRSNVSPCR
jgi:hypothetical protein